MTDLAIIGPDPAFGGGGRALTEALWRAAAELGREPELHFLRNDSLPGAEQDPVFTRRQEVRSPLPVPDAEPYKLMLAAMRIGKRVTDAGACFVCAPTASYGYGAVLSRRPYACWAGTTVDEEWSGRRHGLDRLRRAAHGLGAPVAHKLESSTLSRARVLWAISDATRRALAAVADRPEEDVRVVPIPVDAQHFTPLADEEWERELSRPQLVFVGRANDPRKNLPLLLEAFALLRKRLPGARLALVGSPPDGPVPDGVEVLGEVASVAEPLRRGALLVLPSLQEGFGLVVAEALACGVPALVTPSGGPEELVETSGGGEVLSGFDANELAERARKLLGDRDRLRAMRTRGRAYVALKHDPARLRDALREALVELDGG